MGSLKSCPRCGREAKRALTSNWFPVHRCSDCGEKYCNECGDGRGTTCPECGSSSHMDLDKVHA
jgi:DNA-directed RNA polymerase subunit RPC12/RpoP